MADDNDTQISAAITTTIMETTSSIDQLKEQHLSPIREIARDDIESDIVNCCLKRLNDYNVADIETDNNHHQQHHHHQQEEENQRTTNGDSHTNEQQQQQSTNDVKDGTTTSSFRGW